MVHKVMRSTSYVKASCRLWKIPSTSESVISCKVMTCIFALDKHDCIILPCFLQLYDFSMLYHRSIQFGSLQGCQLPNSRCPGNSSGDQRTKRRSNCLSVSSNLESDWFPRWITVDHTAYEVGSRYIKTRSKSWDETTTVQWLARFLNHQQYMRRGEFS